MERPDEITDDSGLPQPGTEEPEPRAADVDEEDNEHDDTEGPGNVSVDEPTAPALAPEEIEQESPG